MQHSLSRYEVTQDVYTDNGLCFMSPTICNKVRFQNRIIIPILHASEYPRWKKKKKTVKTVKNIRRKCREPSLRLLIHRSTPGDYGSSPTEMLMWIRSNLLTKKERRVEGKCPWPMRSSGVKKINPMDAVHIRESSVVQAKVAPRSFTVQTKTRSVSFDGTEMTY